MMAEAQVEGEEGPFDAAVVGGGVVGCSVALALARRGRSVVLLEAEPALALGASGTNSGILHSGFDSIPGELETDLILRSTTLREEALEALAVPVLRCGAVMRDAPEGYPRNGVAATRGPDGALEIPGEWVTDPVVWTLALAAAAEVLGAEVRTSWRVAGFAPAESPRRAEGAGLVVGSDDGREVRARQVVNCAGLRADEVAAAAGEPGAFGVYPRKGEFFVFAPPPGTVLDRILLPVPTARTKGVLVFPTIDGHVIAGPTAVDGEDKDDWSVRPDAADAVLGPAAAMWPPLRGLDPIGSYAGLRPAGRGVNYVIEPSRSRAGLLHVAAIRSTGLSASLGIGEHVADRLAPGVAPVPIPRLAASPTLEGEWWRRAATHRATA
jgi:glycerol-3-phosphate dehydrogenase